MLAFLVAKIWERGTCYYCKISTNAKKDREKEVGEERDENESEGGGVLSSPVGGSGHCNWQRPGGRAICRWRKWGPTAITESPIGPRWVPLVDGSARWAPQWSSDITLCIITDHDTINKPKIFILFILYFILPRKILSCKWLSCKLNMRWKN